MGSADGYVCGGYGVIWTVLVNMCVVVDMCDGDGVIGVGVGSGDGVGAIWGVLVPCEC